MQLFILSYIGVCIMCVHVYKPYNYIKKKPLQMVLSQ